MNACTYSSNLFLTQLRGALSTQKPTPTVVAYLSKQRRPPLTTAVHFTRPIAHIHTSQNIASGRDFIDTLSVEVSELEAKIALAAETDLGTAENEVCTRTRAYGLVYTQEEGAFVIALLYKAVLNQRWGS